MDDVKTIKSLLVAILTILSFGAIYFARDMFLPIVIGLLVSLTLSPIVRSLARFGIPEAVTAFILIFGTATALFAGAYVLRGPASAMLADAPQMGVDLRLKLSGMLASIEDVKSATEQVESLANGGDATSRVAIQQPGLLAFAAGSLASFVSLTAVGLILAFFILASGNLFYIKLVEALPTFSDKRRAVKAVRDVERQISHYFLTISAINICLGFLVAVAMYALGLPNPMLWGVLAFALNYLPFVGALVGVLAVAAFGILSFDSIGIGLWPAAVYLVLTSLEAQLITPSILGRRLELNTVSVFLTVIVWSWLWSIPGALMAVPFLVLVKVISDNVAGLRVFGSFLGARRLRPALVSDMD